MKCIYPFVSWLVCVCVAPVVLGAEDFHFAPVPGVQAVPLPEDQISFQVDGRELTRYYYSTNANRPFLYPVVGPGSNRSLTRMGHPHDPITHKHHNSVWISHQMVDGVNFWEDTTNHIVHQRIEKLEDGTNSAHAIVYNHWVSGGKILLAERRQITVRLLPEKEWMLVLDSCFEAVNGPVTLGQTAFGMVGVRMAKSIGVNDGKGVLRNSEGGQGEPALFRKPARWVDYSGAITDSLAEGITLMDHPANSGHPVPFHVRNDGWMGCSLTLSNAVTIAGKQCLNLRYGLYVHNGVPSSNAINACWETFQKLPQVDLSRQPKP